MATYKQADYEALRRRCVELKKEGWKQAAIARAFGLTEGWVSQTLKTYHEQGEAGLTTGKRTGAPSRLTTEQLDQLTRELARGAEQHGFSDQVWTRLRINEVITKLFGVSYDPSQVGRLLKKVGWTGAPERPTETSSTSSPAGPAGCGQLASRAAARAQKKRKLRRGRSYIWTSLPRGGPSAICCLLLPTAGLLEARRLC